LFHYPIGSSRGSAALKFKQKLIEGFGPNASSVEISCSVKQEFLSFSQLHDVVVDPYVFNGKSLPEIVAGIAEEKHFAAPIKMRQSLIGPEAYNQLLQFVGNSIPFPSKITETDHSSIPVSWSAEIERRGGILLKNYYRYFQYLAEGTVNTVNQLLAQEINTPSRSIEMALEFPDEDVWELIESFSVQEKYDIRMDDFDDEMESHFRSNEDGWFDSDENSLWD